MTLFFSSSRKWLSCCHWDLFYYTWNSKPLSLGSFLTAIKVWKISGPKPSVQELLPSSASPSRANHMAPPLSRPYPTSILQASTLSLCNVWHISVWSRTSAMNAPRHSFTELRDRCVKHSVSVSKSVSSNQTTATLARISILNSSSCDIEN